MYDPGEIVQNTRHQIKRLFIYLLLFNFPKKHSQNP